MAGRFVIFCALVLLVTQLRAQGNYAKGELILKVKENAYWNQSPEIILNALQLDKKEFHLEKNFPKLKSNARKASSGLERIYSLKFSESIEVKKMCKYLSRNAMLEYCEPRYLAHFAYTPNDPSFGSQAFLNQIKAPEAWDIEKGDTTIIVAIVDAGIALNHPDLSKKVYRNYDDPINGIDDDNDGYVDNYFGWNFVDDSRYVEYTDSDHGVHVAGIAGAETDNGIGVSGVGFNVKIMPLLAGKRIEVSHGYEAIVYAAEQGADIINCSWGAYFPSFMGLDAVRHAEALGALIVAAAGNESSADAYFPAAFDEVMAVVAVDNIDFKAGLSNYGYYMDIAAPGLQILSTTGKVDYNTRSGTSMAAPVVSGAAALLKSLRPGLSALELKEILKQSSDTFPSNAVNDRYRNQMGQGRLNVEKALGFTAKPVWHVSNLSFSDSNDDWFVPGDTLSLSFSIQSLLENSSQLSLKLSHASSYLQVIDSVHSLASLVKNQIVQVDDIFRFVVLPGTPVNHQAALELVISDSSSTKRIGFDVLLNSNYLNVEVNKLKTSVSSHGLFGYTEYPEKQGLGFVFKSGASLMYEGGFALGFKREGISFVYDRLRGPGDVGQKDWRIESVLKRDKNYPGFKASGIFSDSSAINTTGIEVSQTIWANDSSQLNNVIFLEYTVVNRSAFLLEELYAALFTDFDIGDYLRNKASFNGQRYLAYTYSDEAADRGIFLASQLIEPSEKFKVYHIAAVPGGEAGVEIDDGDGFTELDKYNVLSGVKNNAGKDAGTDVFQSLAAGPFRLASGDSLRFRFAVMAANTLDSLFDIADGAYASVKGSLPSSVDVASNDVPRVYPVPAKEHVFVELDAPSTLRLFGIDGREYEVKAKGSWPLTLDLSGLASGLYFLEINSEKYSGNVKLIKR